MICIVCFSDAEKTITGSLPGIKCPRCGYYAHSGWENPVFAWSQAERVLASNALRARSNRDRPASWETLDQLQALVEEYRAEEGLTGDVEKMKVERFFQSRVGRLWIRQSSEGGVYIGLDDGAPAASYCSVESAEDAFRSRGTGIPAWDLLGDIDDLPLLLSDWDQRVRPSVN